MPKVSNPGAGDWPIENGQCAEDEYCILLAGSRGRPFQSASEESTCNYSVFFARRIPIQLGIGQDERAVICSMGGGQGAFSIWVSIIQALEMHLTKFDRAYLITGPYLEPDDSRELLKMATGLPWLKVIQYVPDMTAWMVASDLFVGAAGSNMLGEILATGCNAIAVPRQVRETEQLIHSSLLASKGLIRMCNLATALNGGLVGPICDGLDSPLRQRHNVLLNGVDRYAGHLIEWYTRICC